MIAAQYQKCIPLAFTQATTSTNATHEANGDTLGFNYVTVKAVMPKAAATNSSAKWQVFRVQSGDTTSSFTDIPGAVGTTNTVAGSSTFVLPANNDTSNPQVIKVFIAKTGTIGRYINVNYQTPGATDYNQVYFELECSRGDQKPNTTTEQGVAAAVYI